MIDLAEGIFNLSLRQRESYRPRVLDNKINLEFDRMIKSKIRIILWNFFFCYYNVGLFYLLYLKNLFI